MLTNLIKEIYVCVCVYIYIYSALKYILYITYITLCAVLCLVTHSCPTLCNPMDYSPPGSSVHGILQARILEWVAMPSSMESSQGRDRIQVSGIAERFSTV